LQVQKLPSRLERDSHNAANPSYTSKLGSKLFKKAQTSSPSFQKHGVVVVKLLFLKPDHMKERKGKERRDRVAMRQR
jgi:hypothetical protein